MKKTVILCAAAAFMGLLITSCATNKQAEFADTYEDAKPITAENGELSDEALAEADSKDSEKKSTTKKKKKNAIEQFFTFGNKDDFQKFQEISVCESDVTGMHERRAQTVIRTDNYMAGWGSYVLLAYYYVQFDEVNRQKLLNAIDSYLSDFDNKRLNRKGKRTERTYGKVAYRLDWGSVSATTPNYGSGEGYMGYKFVKGSPYFTLSNYPFTNDHYDDASETSMRESLPLTYYFTKAQLKNLADFISNENISDMITEMNQYYGYSDADKY